MFGFPAQYSEQVDLNVPRLTAREAIEYTLDRLGWSYFRSDTDTFVVTIGFNPSSWGEKMTISLANPGKLKILSKSRVFQFFDWGKNRKNVTDFLRLFEIRVIRDARFLTEVGANFERDGESRVDKLLEDNELI